MAGFLFNMGGDRDAGTTREAALDACLSKGVYHTRGVRPTKGGRWSTQALALLGDFLSMKEGDHVYFLCGRNIYGIGRLVSLGASGCRLGNFPDACAPAVPVYSRMRDALLVDLGTAAKSTGARWLCTFEPSPLFFRQGVDMDVALASRPQSMRRLPSNQDRTFIKLDDEEDVALSRLILLANRSYFTDPADPDMAMVATGSCASTHAHIRQKLLEADYSLDLAALLPRHREGKRLSPEMALETALIDRLMDAGSTEATLFGHLDMVAHQIPASPPKKFVWMDKMDIFGYAYAPTDHLSGLAPPITRYVVVEVKPGPADTAAVSQVMSYVDWITEHWAGHDPTLVSAYLVAASYPDSVMEAAAEYGKRYHTVGRREESRTLVWDDLSLVSYNYDRQSEELSFQKVESDG